MNVYVSESNHIVSSETLSSLPSVLRRLGAGVSRTVFSLGDGTVLKVQKANWDSGSNLSEAHVWEQVKGTEYEKHFAEVIAYAEDGSWLIMKEVESVFGDDMHGWAQWYNEIGTELTHETKVGDLHPGNVGTTVQG